MYGDASDELGDSSRGLTSFCGRMNLFEARFRTYPLQIIIFFMFQHQFDRRKTGENEMKFLVKVFQSDILFISE